jgi:NAD(P)-dependent dehydrogenase (short-subunit alcohol dehydrogenase family)
MSEPQPLAGKTALVTGASRGFGFAIARRLRDSGAHLILAARSFFDLSELVREDVDDGLELRGLCVDLSRPADVDKLIDFCLDADESPPDIVVNNAAIQGPIGPLTEIDFAAWRAVMEVNLLAPARICQRLIGSMREKRWGKIINISGGGGAGPPPGV